MFTIETYGEYSGAWRSSQFGHDTYASVELALAYVKRYEREFSRKLWRIVDDANVVVKGYGK
jgi:hypothetical protein